MEATIETELSSVYVKKGAIFSLKEVKHKHWPKVEKVAVVIDQTVYELYQDLLNPIFNEANDHYYILPLQVSENLKTLEGAMLVYQFLNTYHFTRQDAILAVGGGVIGDLAGFVAATYMRGIFFAQMPTTLLSQVDSSIGGKNALNVAEAKNNIGTFYQPDFIICDTQFLSTLSRDAFYSGMLEAVKIALISDAVLWEMIKEKNKLESIIIRAIKDKFTMIQGDVCDHHKRMNLNFGHTLGHAFEIHSQFVLDHGIAVGIGMLEILKIAYHAGWTTSLKPYYELVQWMEKEKLPTTYHYDTQQLMESIKHDKKGESQTVTLILTNQVGTCFQKKVTYKALEQQLRGQS